MKYTAAELVGLPGMPNTERGVRIKAQREGWQVESSGTRYLYLLPSLPEETQLALSVQPVSYAAEATRGRGHERAQLVATALRLIANGTAKRKAETVTAAGTEYSSRSIRRWRKMVKGHPSHEWPQLLSDSSRIVAVDIDGELWQIFKSDYLRGSKPDFASCYRRTVAIAEQRGVRLPSLKTFVRRFRAEVPRTVEVLEREGERALARLFPAQERDRAEFGALEAVNVDGHRADVMVLWPDGTKERPMLLGIQDLASDKILAWRVDRSENADLVRLTFGDMIEQWGIPDHVYQDNGRAFAAKWLTGHTPNRFRYKIRDEDPRGVLVELGVQVHWTTPYHGQSKPIERAWRDLCANLSRHPAFEGAYLGSDTTKKPHNVGTRAVELSEFLRVADVVIREHNARAGRRSMVTPNAESFNDVFFASYEQRTIRRLTEAQRRFLWLAVDGVTVRTTGEIYLWENRYWSVALTQLRERKVTVRFDPQALHAGIHVYRLDGSYVGFCDCIEKSGFASRDTARDHARKRRAFVKAAKQLSKATVELDPNDIAEMHLAARGAPERAKPAAVAPVFKLPKVERTKQESRQREADADYIIDLGRESGKGLKRRVQ